MEDTIITVENNTLVVTTTAPKVFTVGLNRINMEIARAQINLDKAQDNLDYWNALLVEANAQGLTTPATEQTIEPPVEPSQEPL